MTVEQIEQDSLGAVHLPKDVYYGAQTQRAKENFPISLRGIPTSLIHALGKIKAAAARANASLGLLSHIPADAIARAADEVADGRFDDQFVVDVFQTGSGTSSNMNANEVIAKRANELLTGRRHPHRPVHPNDHVNKGQSSNDVFPTAIHLAVLLDLDRMLMPALGELHDALAERANAFGDILKIGRTHLQDALPVTLGQEFAGYARMIERGRQRLSEIRPVLEEVPLGATAVGTGANTHPAFASRVLAEINARAHLQLWPTANGFEALGSRHALSATSGMLKTLAVDLMKIGNDLRLLSSGPRCGLAEIALPSLQPGSSMMPGKVNPVLPEALCQVAAQVIGHDAAITIDCQSGLLELNVMMPLLADNLLDAVHLLARSTMLTARHCVTGITARPDRCRQFIDQSLALATALVPRVGYDAAARLAKSAYEEGLTIRVIAERETDIKPEELDRLLDPRRLADGGLE